MPDHREVATLSEEESLFKLEVSLKGNE